MSQKQTQLMLEYLKAHGNISGLEAIHNLGIICYTKCISNLRAQGAKINRVWEKKRSKFGNKRFARYYLLKAPKKLYK